LEKVQKHFVDTAAGPFKKEILKLRIFVFRIFVIMLDCGTCMGMGIGDEDFFLFYAVSVAKVVLDPFVQAVIEVDDIIADNYNLLVLVF
jgi:hypothetical protein